MQEVAKKIVSILNVIIFLLLAPYLILYAQGKLYSLNKKNIIETGGIFLQSQQKNLEIYLKGQKIGKIGLVPSSFFCRNLYPKNYLLEIKKPGYIPISLKVDIETGIVKQFYDILLLKEKINFSPIGENIQNIKLFPEDLILAEKIDQKKHFLFLDQKDLKEFYSTDNTSTELIDFDFLEKKSLFKIQERNYLFLDLASNKNIPLSFTKNLTKISLGPNNNIIYLEKNNLLIRNLDSNRETIISREAVNFYLKKNILYVFTNNGFLLEYNFDNESKTIINKKPINNPEIDFGIEKINKFLLLIRGDGLYVLEDGIFKKIFKDVQDYKISFGENELILKSGNEIWVGRLNKSQSNIDFYFLDRISSNKIDFYWATNNNVILIANNIIKLFYLNKTEDIILLAGIKEIPEGKIIYHQKSKNLYLLEKDGQLFISETIF
jgi:hypothetical protein